MGGHSRGQWRPAEASLVGLDDGGNAGPRGLSRGSGGSCVLPRLPVLWDGCPPRGLASSLTWATTAGRCALGEEGGEAWPVARSPYCPSACPSLLLALALANTWSGPGSLWSPHPAQHGGVGDGHAERVTGPGEWLEQNQGRALSAGTSGRDQGQQRRPRRSQCRGRKEGLACGGRPTAPQIQTGSTPKYCSHPSPTPASPCTSNVGESNLPTGAHPGSHCRNGGLPHTFVHTTLPEPTVHTPV